MSSASVERATICVGSDPSRMAQPTASEQHPRGLGPGWYGNPVSILPVHQCIRSEVGLTYAMQLKTEPEWECTSTEYWNCGGTLVDASGLPLALAVPVEKWSAMFTCHSQNLLMCVSYSLFSHILSLIYLTQPFTITSISQMELAIV